MRCERVAHSVIALNNLEQARVDLALDDDANTVRLTADIYRGVAVVELDEVLDLAGLDVRIDRVVPAELRVRERIVRPSRVTMKGSRSFRRRACAPCRA